MILLALLLAASAAPAQNFAMSAALDAAVANSRRLAAGAPQAVAALRVSALELHPAADPQVDPKVWRALMAKIKAYGTEPSGSDDPMMIGFESIRGPEHEEHQADYLTYEYMISEHWTIDHDSRWHVDQWTFTHDSSGRIVACDHQIVHEDRDVETDRGATLEELLQTCAPEALAKHDALIGFWTRYQPVGKP